MRLMLFQKSWNLFESRRASSRTWSFIVEYEITAFLWFFLVRIRYSCIFYSFIFCPEHNFCFHKNKIMKINNKYKMWTGFCTKVYVYVMLCAICYHFYNLKNVKNTLWGVLLLVKKSATLLKVTLLSGYFLRFLSYTNSIESRKVSHMIKELSKYPAVEQGEIVGWCNVVFLNYY